MAAYSIASLLLIYKLKVYVIENFNITESIQSIVNVDIIIYLLHQAFYITCVGIVDTKTFSRLWSSRNGCRC